jgi:Holliday junction DNA helicase RuvA
VIAAVHGVIQAKGVGWVVVEISGLGFRVEVPTTVATHAHIGSRIELHTHLVVREDALTLFGFETTEALDMFTVLLGVSGVGPRSALGVLSELTPAEVASAVADENDKPFRRVSGIGAKTAKLIMVSLAGKLDHIVLPSSAHEEPAQDDISAQVIEGLTGLGWSENESIDAVAGARDSGVADNPAVLLKAALALLQKPGRK